MAVKKEEEAKLYKCIVRSMDKDEKEMIFGINGKITQVELGKEIELTKDQIAVIKSGKITKHVPVKDKEGNPTGKNREEEEPRYIIEVVID